MYLLLNNIIFLLVLIYGLLLRIRCILLFLLDNWWAAIDQFRVIDLDRAQFGQCMALLSYANIFYYALAYQHGLQMCFIY